MTKQNQAVQAQAELTDGWLIDGGLIYRLNNEGFNCDEINVAMVNGSRDVDARHDAAVELLAELRSADASRSAAREQARNEALEEAAKACADERVDADVTGTPGDIAYNMAINHCIEAIRCLKAEAPAASKEGDDRE